MPGYSHYAVYFPGHSPPTVADRNYFGLDQANFDRAVEWFPPVVSQIGRCMEPLAREIQHNF